MGKRIQTRHLLVIGSVLALIVAVGIVLFIRISGIFLDEWETKSVNADINGDGTNEVLALSNRKMSITVNDNIIWETPKEWKVVDFLVCDIDRDEETEVMFLVWKRGNYGEYTPFWEENDNEFSQHIFIYQWEDNRLAPIWMSSKLKPQVESWNAVDNDKIHIITDSGEDTIWIWGNWGLLRWK